MKRRRPLQFGELMIVNPGSPGLRAVFLAEDGQFYPVQGLDQEDKPSEGEGQVFLSEDGSLYQVQGLVREEDSHGEGQFFISDDGTVYQMQSASSAGVDQPTAISEEDRKSVRFFLGEDGTLSEIVR